jgi:hypothetical protein
MLETNEPGIFKNLQDGNLYKEVYLYEIFKLVDVELDKKYSGWTDPNENLSVSGSAIIRSCFPEKYWNTNMEYCEKNNILHFDKKGLHRFFQRKIN